jgi:hypothetical protein
VKLATTEMRTAKELRKLISMGTLIVQNWLETRQMGIQKFLYQASFKVNIDKELKHLGNFSSLL